MNKLDDIDLKKIEKLKECLMHPPEERSERVLLNLMSLTKVTPSLIHRTSHSSNTSQ
jgi:hypothetical protein